MWAPRESELVMSWKTILGISALTGYAIKWFKKNKESAMGDPQKPEQRPGQPGTPQQPRPGQQPQPGRQDESEEEKRKRQPGEQEPGGQQR